MAATLDAIEAATREAVAAAEAEARAAPEPAPTSWRPRSGATGLGVAELTYRAAIAAGIAQEMERDPSVVLIGEDVGAAGGVFKLTEGLFDRFGAERVRDTPISEQAIVGAAMGAAMTGLRPIAELMFSDFFAVTWDMVINQIAKTRYMTDGQVSLPLVLRTANGAGLRFGAQHSQSIENWAMAIPGLKVVAPSTPADMKGLMAAAIRDPDPVIVCEHKALFAVKGEVPDGEHVDTLGTARIVRAGPDVTIVALAAMVPKAVEAAERLAAEHGIDAEVIDLRSLVPLDTAAILASVRKTSRLFTVEENPRLCRLGRGDRLDRRRRGLLQPRRPDRADHHSAHPAAVGRGARGPGDPVGRPDRRHGQAPPGRRRVSGGRRGRPDGRVLGTGRMGSRWPSAWPSQGLTVVLYNRTPERAEALAERIGASRCGDRRRRRPRGADVISRWSPTTPPCATCSTARTASPPASGPVPCDRLSTVLPDTIAVRAGGPGPRSPASSMRPSRAASRPRVPAS